MPLVNYSFYILNSLLLLLTLLFAFNPDTDVEYMMYFPPSDSEGEHSRVNSSWLEPKLWPKRKNDQRTESYNVPQRTESYNVHLLSPLEKAKYALIETLIGITFRRYCKITHGKESMNSSLNQRESAALSLLLSLPRENRGEELNFNQRLDR